MDKIIESIEKIISLEESIRDHINTSRYQAGFVTDHDIWNQICSSLDTIGDTVLCIRDYINADYPKNVGLKYVYTYGLLQALFIQQDALCNLSEALGENFKLSDKLRKIRFIRNASIGHPTKHQPDKTNTYYNYISRISLSKNGFKLMKSSKKHNTQFEDIDINQILIDQLKEIESGYKKLAEKLDEEDKMHKEKYRGKLLVDIFHSGMGYTFEKVAQGIHSPDSSNVSFGLTMLKSIQETYNEFEKALSERNDLNEYTKYDLEEYKHALSQLEKYLSGDNAAISESDARIFHFYIKEQHKHFVQIASEIDEEYKEAA